MGGGGGLSSFIVMKFITTNRGVRGILYKVVKYVCGCDEHMKMTSEPQFSLGLLACHLRLYMSTLHVYFIKGPLHFLCIYLLQVVYIF